MWLEVAWRVGAFPARRSKFLGCAFSTLRSAFAVGRPDGKKQGFPTLGGGAAVFEQKSLLTCLMVRDFGIGKTGQGYCTFNCYNEARIPAGIACRPLLKMQESWPRVHLEHLVLVITHNYACIFILALPNFHLL